jgi:outer membrane protein OmpA-like peptidoglycan-associated protein
LADEKSAGQKREEVRLAEAKLTEQRREETRLADAKAAEQQREETRLAELKRTEQKRDETRKAEAKVAELKLAEAQLAEEKTKKKKGKKAKSETETKEDTKPFTTPTPIGQSDVAAKPASVVAPVQPASVVAPLALQNQNGTSNNAPKTGASNDFGETMSNFEQTKSSKSSGESATENRGFAPSESQNTEGYKYIETGIATFDKNSNNALQQVKVGVIAMKSVKNAVVVTDVVGKLLGLRTEDGLAIALDELPQQSEMSNEKGRVKMPLIIGERYLFNFSKAGYEPKFIIKTILVNDNRVAALLVPEKFTNAKPNPTVMQQPKVDPTPQPIETQRVTYSEPIINAQPVESQPISYNQNNQTVDTNITLADNFGDTKTEMSRTFSQGQSFELKNIYYGYGDAEVSGESKKELEPLVALMQQDPEMVIEIAAYTDSRGKAPFNLNLSQLRADNIKSHLVEQEITPNRIKTIGYGETLLKNKCADNVDCTEEQHQVNRRTEIRLLKGGRLLSTKPSVDNIPVQKGENTEGPILADASNNSAKYLNTSSQKNRYLVIVGTYAKSSNAEKQRQKVVASGFVETDLVQFQGTGYYGVCVRHFDNLKEAQSLSNYINAQKEFEAFVKELK